MVPRAVLVERPSEYDELLARHATHEQVRFFLEQRGRALDEVLERHAALAATHRAVLGAVPADWRAATVMRADLDRFLFEPGDVVLALGQDGLVANVAKYLDGQPVIGLNPDPAHVPGVLVRHPPQAAADLIADLASGAARIEERTMVARPARRRAGGARAQRDLRRARHAPVGALHDRARGAQRAPVLVRRDRGDRHGRDGLGGEHQPPARPPARPPRARRTPRSPSSCARRGRAPSPARP